VVADLVRADAAEAGVSVEDEGARVFAAFVMTIALGWRLFAETALLAAGLDESSPEAYSDRILGYVRHLAASAIGPSESPLDRRGSEDSDVLKRGSSRRPPEAADR
jgi:hypothetical protein